MKLYSTMAALLAGAATLTLTNAALASGHGGHGTQGGHGSHAGAKPGGNAAHPATKPAPKPHPRPTPRPKPSHPHPGKPGHGGQYGYGGQYGVSGTTLPWQTVRYLRVNNQSGVTLTIFGQLTQDGPTYNWTVEPGVTTFLAIDGQRIAAAQVYLWAEADGRRWTSARDGLTFVSEAYQAYDVGVFTYTFNP